MATEPRTLQEAIIYFSDPVNTREYLVARRWPNSVQCPRCGSHNVLFLENYNRWHCREKHSAPQFTLKTGTIMEDSPIGLDKWMLAMWQIVNCKNGISSYEVHRAIGVTQKTAWFLDHRIRFALHQGSFETMMSGHVEADETFVGGKARNMHKARKERALQGARGGQVGKVAVLGILDRKTKKVRTQVIANRKRPTVQKEVRKHVEAGSAIYTDQLESYRGLDEFEHQVIDHAVQYVDGQVHTNGMENYWSLLKRTLHGTYISVEPFHLFRYLDEQAFRYNNRKDENGNKLKDGDRFDMAVRQIVGKRLTWDRLTGKEAVSPTCAD